VRTVNRNQGVRPSKLLEGGSAIQLKRLPADAWRFSKQSTIDKIKATNCVGMGYLQMFALKRWLSGMTWESAI